MPYIDAELLLESTFGTSKLLIFPIHQVIGSHMLPLTWSHLIFFFLPVNLKQLSMGVENIFGRVSSSCCSKYLKVEVYGRMNESGGKGRGVYLDFLARSCWSFLQI